MLNVCYFNRLMTPYPKSTMISPFLKIAEVVKVKKHNKTKIGVGSVVKAKVVYLEKITKEGIMRSISK